MIKLVLTCLILVLLNSCGSRYTSAPQRMDNACSVLEQRPKFRPAFRAVEQKWGVPVHVMMATIHQESKFIKNAKTPRKYFMGLIPRGRVSTAYGYAQALDGTWNEYRNSTGRRWAQRDDIRDAADFIGWYMTNSKRRNGVALSDARNQYLNYHEGQSGYARGTHKRKRWLIAVADKVAQRSARYRSQLRGCPI